MIRMINWREVFAGAVIGAIIGVILTLFLVNPYLERREEQQGFVNKTLRVELLLMIVGNEVERNQQTFSETIAPQVDKIVTSGGVTIADKRGNLEILLEMDRLNVSAFEEFRSEFRSPERRPLLSAQLIFGLYSLYDAYDFVNRSAELLQISLIGSLPFEGDSYRQYVKPAYQNFKRRVEGLAGMDAHQVLKDLSEERARLRGQIWQGR